MYKFTKENILNALMPNPFKAPRKHCVILVYQDTRIVYELGFQGYYDTSYKYCPFSCGFYIEYNTKNDEGKTVSVSLIKLLDYLMTQEIAAIRDFEVTKLSYGDVEKGLFYDTYICINGKGL